MDGDVECAKKAVDADREKNYEEAWTNYCHAVEFFQLHNKYDKNEAQKKFIDSKVGISVMCFYTAL